MCHQSSKPTIPQDHGHSGVHHTIDECVERRAVGIELGGLRLQCGPQVLFQIFLIIARKAGTTGELTGFESNE